MITKWKLCKSQRKFQKTTVNRDGYTFPFHIAVTMSGYLEIFYYMIWTYLRQESLQE